VLKFGVKNLGRIVSAEVEFAPLTILVGKNNTGKSYLATLMWALAQPSLLSEVRAYVRRPAWFADFVRPFSGSESRLLVLDRNLIGNAVAFIERAANRKISELLSTVFAMPGFKNTKLKLTAAEGGPYEFILEPHDRAFQSDDDGVPRVALFVRIGSSKQLIYILQQPWFDINSNWLANLIFHEVVGYCLFGALWKAYRRQTYIPAARTGIMLALPALVSQSLSASKPNQPVNMPRPLLEFLSRMTENSGVRRRRPAPVRDRLRRELLRGQISIPQESVPDFRYTPEGLDMALPLHATSSMITELAPFMVALDNQPGTHHFIFEEPEAHLHLEAQREMARLIARLVKGGTPVTLTTHSDTFLQQINNLMVLSEHPNREEKMQELGYEKDDLIAPENVKAYEFCPQKSGTVVVPLENTEDGFVVQTLNATLLSLAKETLSLRSERNG